MTDLLAAYRRKPLIESGKDYVAFGGKDRVERIKIRFAKGLTHAPGYFYLRNISYDGEHGTNCVLLFDFMVVLLKGKNLQSLISSLMLGTVDFIQEFNPDVWMKPADDSPLIEAIEIIQSDEKSSLA